MKTNLQSLHRFTVVKWLKALARYAQGDGFVTHLRRFFRDFKLIVFSTEGLKTVCVTLREQTVTFNVSSDNCKKIIL